MIAEKKGNLLQKINTLTRGEYSVLKEEEEKLLLSYHICPCCLEENQISFLDRRNGETVCVECGYVPPEHLYSSNLPFGYAGSPVNSLAYGNGLGDTLGDKGTFCVLAHSSAYDADKKNLPMSARFIKIMTSKKEHPKILSLLKMGRNNIVQWGFTNHKATDQVLFSNYLGNMLRSVGSYIILKNLRCNLKRIADACFALTLKDLKGSEMYQVALMKMNVDEKVVADILKLCKVKQL